MIEEKLNAARHEVRKGIRNILQVECYRYETAWERLEHIESRIRQLRIPFEYYRSFYPRAELGTADALFEAVHRCGLIGHPGLPTQDLHAALIPAILKNTNAAVLRRFQRRLNAAAHARADGPVRARARQLRLPVPRQRLERPDVGLLERAVQLRNVAGRVQETWFRFLLGALEGIGADLRKRPQVARNVVGLQNALRQQPAHVQVNYVLRFYGGVLSGLYQAAGDFLASLYDLFQTARSLDQAGKDAIIAFLSDEQTRAEVLEFLESLEELAGPLAQIAEEISEAAHQEARGTGKTLGAALSASVARPLDTEDLEDFTWEFGKLLATLVFDLVLAVALQAAGPIIARGKTLVRFVAKAATDRFVAIVEAALRRHPEIVRAIEKLDALLLRIADRPWKRPRSREGGIGAQSQPSGAGGSSSGPAEPSAQPGKRGKGEFLRGAQLRSKFRRCTLKRILAQKNPPHHPLRFLVDEKRKKWKQPKSRRHEDLIQVPTVWEAGHVQSKKMTEISGGIERVAIQDAYTNQAIDRGAEPPRIPGMGVLKREIIDIGGIPVDRRSAELWVKEKLLGEKWVRHAKPHPGWNTDFPDMCR